jgi:hypothetical protein
MTLPTFESKDKIPAGFESLYAEKDGKFAPIVDDPAGLSANQRRLLDEKKKLEGDLGTYKGAIGDLKPEQVQEILKGHREAEEKRARQAGEFDKLLEKRVNEVRAELDPKVKAGEDAITQLSAFRFNQAVEKEAIKAGVIPEDLEDVLAIVREKRMLAPSKKDASKIVVLDADGDETGKTLEKFFTEDFKKLKPKFYKAGGGSGGGAGGGGTPRSGSGGAIAASDTAGFLANLDKIAKGEVKVAQ